eukprot:CAMPEP_0183807166 /NCGR_PEP_ID=MMETSP0803_2-20130417/40777_1 /TAXON_ID=195967 /ORGANISM="Crustomastix stigmata, Strain CCMP3273" /LENGTH=1848 /DNA_ID=CAMNT_0026051939 /DNA_START=183 /DNA_END=5729 /DNA_ORIENTATION=+
MVASQPGQILGASLDKIAGLASSRKHAALISLCKEVAAELRALDPSDGVPVPSPRAKREPLPDAVLGRLLEPLRQACESKQAKVVETALDCLQKVVAHGFVRGEADALGGATLDDTAPDTPADPETLPAPPGDRGTSGAEGEGETGRAGEASTQVGAAVAGVDGGEEGSKLESAPPGGGERADRAGAPPSGDAGLAQRQAGEVVELMCKGYELGEEAVELQVLKGLLTAVSCNTFQVHGEALLRVVRTCYNIFLGSKSEVNQTTAKASLTQMLTVVFHRMEVDSPIAPAPTIVVAELLHPMAEQTPLASFVQQFITRVAQDIESTFYPAEDGTDIDSASGAFADVQEGAADYDRAGLSSPKVAGKPPPIRLPSEAMAGEGSTTASASAEELGSATLHRDAFLVFRALCKLSMKAPADGAAESFQARGKILSLELLKILLENGGPHFSSSPKFVAAIKQYLCVSLVKNAQSPLPAAFQLSCSIFLTLLARFRQHLKAEISIFFPLIYLKPLEQGATPGAHAQRATVLRALAQQCEDAQLLVDLFVNYDCDINAGNLFERTVNTLVRVAQGAGPDAAPEEAELRSVAMKGLVTMMRSLSEWLEYLTGDPIGAEPTEEDDDDARTPTRMDSANGGQVAPGVARQSGGALDTAADGESSPAHTTRGTSTSVSTRTVVGDVDSSEAGRFEQQKAAKLEWQEGIALFNKKPKKGIAFLQKAGKLGSEPEELAEFLRNTQGLDKTLIGDYLGEREEPNLTVMHAYVDFMDFTALKFDDAIRKFLEGFRLPGEAQKIDRLMEKFAERFCKCNPDAFKTADTAFVLAYSVIMLNTDAHNPQVKNKMTKAEFLKNNRGIDDGADIDAEFMSALYDHIVNNEIKMKDPMVDSTGGASAPAAAGANSSSKINQTFKDMTNRMGLDVFVNLMAGRRGNVAVPDTSEAVLEAVRARQKGAGDFYSATEPAMVRPMLEVAWPPMLAAFSVTFDEVDELELTQQCLEGFRHAIHLTALLGMETLRDAFVTSLAKLTLLHSPSAMRRKNASALRALVSAAETDGDNLQGAWVHILSCISRYEHLYQLGVGYNDSTLFAQKGAEKTTKEKTTVWKRFTTPTKRKSSTEARAGQSVISAQAVGPFKDSSSNSAEDNMELRRPPLEVVESLKPDELARIFLGSERLGGDAVVEFVKALCSVALDELGASSPRVYSLAKIVEIAHFNMTRIRLVWSRIWAVLSDFFITVGTHQNLQVAMYVVDSLRQLAMKFLERDELANYTFQNDFLKPFVVVMRQSNALEIRELIVRCMSQMVMARVSNVKSGWKTMFMVFTIAATDGQRGLVMLAFETIEKVIREYFSHITETDRTTFTDCVQCLIAFTNTRCSPDVSLNAIAFLRFCALKLAEGMLGNLEEAASEKPPPEGEEAGEGTTTAPVSSPLKSPMSSRRAATTCFTDADAHLYFWFPLLEGLSSLAFDPRPPIRRSALEVLFDTLRFHGETFSDGFWVRIFDSVLFPIFDQARAVGTTSEEDPEARPAAWLQETSQHTLKLVVGLYVQFAPQVHAVLPALLELLTGLIRHESEAVAANGVASLRQLVLDGGGQLDDEQWDTTLEAIETGLAECAPDVGALCEQALTGRALILACEGQRRRASTTLALAEVAGSVHEQYAESLTQVQRERVLEQIRCTYEAAYGTNTDLQCRAQLRTAVAGATSASAASSAGPLPDPPLVALEVGAASAYLAALTAAHRTDGAVDDTLDARIVTAVATLLRRAATGYGSGNQGAAEGEQRTPVVVAALQQAKGLRPELFRQHVSDIFPHLVSLVRTPEAPREVLAALADVLSAQVGPLALAGAKAAAAEFGARSAAAHDD